MAGKEGGGGHEGGGGGDKKAAIWIGLAAIAAFIVLIGIATSRGGTGG